MTIIFSPEGLIIAVLASIQLMTLLITGIIIHQLQNRNNILEQQNEYQPHTPKHLSAFYLTKEDIDTTLNNLDIKLELTGDQYNEIASRTLNTMTEDLTDQIKYTLEAMKIYRPYSLQRELDEPEDTRPAFE